MSKSVNSETAPPYRVGYETTPSTGAEDAIIQRALRILAERNAPGQAITSPEDTRNYLRLKMGEYEHEVFMCIFLDNRHRVIAFEELFHGTIDSTSVHTREVVKTALRHNAAAAILAHNHPSGVTEPSNADEAITRRVRDSLSLIDVRVLDHYVVSATESTSFAEKGLI